MACYIYLSSNREEAGDPLLRASSDHRFTVGALRARRIVCLLPSDRSEVARCASIFLHGAPSKLARRSFSKEGHPYWSNCGRRGSAF